MKRVFTVIIVSIICSTTLINPLSTAAYSTIDTDQMIDKLEAQWDQIRSTFREAREECNELDSRREIRQCQKKLRQKLRKVRKAVQNLQRQYTALEKEVQTIRSNSISDATSDNTSSTTPTEQETTDTTPAVTGKIILNSLPLTQETNHLPTVLTRNNQQVARIQISNTTNNPIQLKHFNFMCTGEWASNPGAIDNILWIKTKRTNSSGGSNILTIERSDQVYDRRNCSQEVRVKLVTPFIIEPESIEELVFYYDTDAGGLLNQNFQIRFTANTFFFTDQNGNEIPHSIGKTNAPDWDQTKMYLYGGNLIYEGFIRD